MAIKNNVSVNELIAQGKNFPWKKPLCPNCNSHLWWHGFVLAFFSIFWELSVWLPVKSDPANHLLVTDTQGRYEDKYKLWKKGRP
ncbi:MAG: hypothetical protein PF689_09430 [Deltaproteobacteria bacterium]|nr:hypothetical protein [Deltaproteobacteria bacterium]